MPDRAAADGERTDTDNGELCGDQCGSCCWRGKAAAAGSQEALDIENRVHWVRDVTFDEDRSQVRTGNAPQVMAAFRNLTSTLVRWAGHTNIAAALRRHAAHVSEAFALIGIHPYLTQE